MQQNANLAHVVPHSFCFFADFPPSLSNNGPSSGWVSVAVSLRNGGFPAPGELDALTSFEQVRVLASALATGAAARVPRSHARRPGICEDEVIDSRAGLIDATPDAVPVISAVDSPPGFHIASGFPDHGPRHFGPAAGNLMADLVADAVPIFDPTPYWFERP